MALLKSINVPLGTKAIDFCLKGISGYKLLFYWQTRTRYT